MPTTTLLQRVRTVLCLLLAVLGGAASLAAQVERVEQLRYPALPEVSVPEPERHVLDNGIVVMLLEDHELPLVEARAIVRTGARWEPADKIGLAGLTGQVMRSGGTTSIASDALDDLLEDKAAVIETSIGTTSGNAFMSCLAEDLDEMLGIFADVLRHPAFEAAKLEVAKNQMVSSIARQNDNPQQILGREFTEIIYGADSPYAANPTYETAANIDRDDLVAWHAAYFRPNNVILGLVGDFDRAAALALVRDRFGDWPQAAAPDHPAATYQQQPRPGIYFAEKEDVTQSFVAMGHLGILRNNPDYFAVEVMNQVLSGSFGSRLFSNVRSKKGLAYQVGGGVRAGWDYPGVAQLTLSTKTETTVAGIEALIEEARGLTARPPTDDEVKKAKDAILNSFVFNSDSTGEILNQQLLYEYYGYPLDWLERYRKGIEATTTAEVRAAAEKYLHPDRFAILVVGKAEGTDRPLAQLGEVHQVDISIPEPAEAEVEVTEAGKERAAELLAKAVEAVGGATRIDAVHGLQTAGATEVQTPQGAMQIAVKTTLVFPDKIRNELTLPFGVIVQAMDGDEAFMETPRGTMTMPPSQRDDLKQGLLRNLVSLLRNRNDASFSAAVVGDDDVDGTAVELVRIEVDGQATTLGIDPDSGRVLSLTFRGSGPGGAPGEMREVQSDFRDTDGLSLPYRTTTTFDGKPVQSTTVDSIVVDPAVDPALFTRPTEEAGG